MVLEWDCVPHTAHASSAALSTSTYLLLSLLLTLTVDYVQAT